jgi:hypothetical protein
MSETAAETEARESFLAARAREAAALSRYEV